ncbi:DUF2889 domain-containing protein [Amphritea sp. 2_MG-2023]|uniref:DUF2889 domain-containing protein n=1 Tax=Amphritea TaxID=515417 RepID=UPI001C073A51|nr:MULTISPECIES: DUF2889 domain-containing protein [Amphritea]MBU2966566.1 DUF2889 domain-containing protein [Amphritea atlantica]MDO6417575.1 DUF2889 domain-containing protein [Amphritea sp. 2_MG-2023]
MPLPSPTERNLQHTRTVTCQGFKRADGLWDIEGHLSDIKTVPIEIKERNNGVVEAGEPIHLLAIRLTIDLELNIHAAIASMDNTPFRLCPSIADRYSLLTGLQIAPGFTKKCKALFSGINGCTHLLELLGPIATTAYQATHQERLEKARQDENHKPFNLNTCHTFDSAGEVVKKYWPNAYEPAELIDVSEIG